MNRRISAALLALVLPLGLVACGSDDEPTAAGDEPTTTAESGDFPVTVRGVELTEAPQRIVSLTPTSTETLFAIGAGEQVVAVDENSNFPEEAPDTDLSGFDPNIEAIAGYEPDLVIVANDHDDVIASLEALDIPVLHLPAAVEIDDVYEEMRDLGAITGHGDEADEVASALEDRVAEIVEEVGDAGEGMTYYYELDPTHYSVTGKTFIGQVLGLLGLESIADAAQADASDYPQLSAEFIVETDPDLVLLADTKCCEQDADAIASRDGWGGMRAVATGGVVELDDDIASRWGPRLSDLLADVAEGVERVAAAG